MRDNLLEVGQAVQHYNANRTRILKYSVEMKHDGLREHKILSAPEYDILLTKVKYQASNWAEKWAKIEQKRIAEEQREATAEEAARRTNEAEAAVNEIRTILEKTLSIDDAIDWNSLKTNASFEEKKPSE